MACDRCKGGARAVRRLLLALPFVLSSCGDEFAKIDPLVELPTAQRAVPIRSPGERPWAVLQIRGDREIVLNGEPVLYKSGDSGLKPGDSGQSLRARLRQARREQTAGSDDLDWVEKLSAWPLVVLADKDLPYSFVSDVLAYLRWRDVAWHKVILGVEGGSSGSPNGIAFLFPFDYGIHGDSAAPATSFATWCRSSAPEDAGGVMGLGRAFGGDVGEAVKIVSVDGLMRWLRVAAEDNGAIQMDAKPSASWQDFLTLLDVAMEVELEQVGDYFLISRR